MKINNVFSALEHTSVTIRETYSVCEHVFKACCLFITMQLLFSDASGCVCRVLQNFGRVLPEMGGNLCRIRQGSRPLHKCNI
jgi:hypothetical protein